MFPRSSRFTHANFEGFRRKMRRFRHGAFIFLFSGAAQNSHFAMVVSKKSDKRAVMRNHLRRQMYPLFREHFYRKGVKINLICLYKGEEITKNREAMTEAVEAFHRFWCSKNKDSFSQVS